MEKAHSAAIPAGKPGEQISPDGTPAITLLDTPTQVATVAGKATTGVATADAIGGLKRFQLRDFANEASRRGASSHEPPKQSLNRTNDTEADLVIEFGRTQMGRDEVKMLRNGSVVPLDELGSDPVSVFMNGKLIARGEVLVVDDQIAVRVTQLMDA